MAKMANIIKWFGGPDEVGGPGPGPPTLGQPTSSKLKDKGTLNGSETPRVVRTVNIVPREGVVIRGLNDILNKEDKNKKKIVIYEKTVKNEMRAKIHENKKENQKENKTEKEQRKSILIKIPYKKVDMIRILQDKYPYEIKGTFYFDDNLKFQSFEIRTNLDPRSADGDAEWTLFFHTHPKRTAERLGLPFFSPPSVEDVMEIYERTLKAYEKRVKMKNLRDKNDLKNLNKGRLGETSVIFASEGVWILQVDHKAFLNMVKRTFGGKMPDDEILELILNETYNGFLVETLREINPDNNDLLNGRKAPDRILELLARLVSEQYGFNLRFISWSTLEQRKELSFTTQLEHLIK